MTYALLNKLTTKPGARDQVVDILLESGSLIRTPGCLMYLVSEDATDPNVIWVTDLWTTKEEHEEALRTPALRPYVDRTLPLLEGMPEQTEIRPVGGEGTVIANLGVEL